jgi:hypothetical protein
MLRRVPVKKVIDADEVSAVLEQALTQMRAEKSGTAGHNHTGFEMHIQLPLERDQKPIAPDQMMPNRLFLAGHRDRAGPSTKPRLISSVNRPRHDRSPMPSILGGSRAKGTFRTRQCAVVSSRQVMASGINSEQAA